MLIGADGVVGMLKNYRVMWINGRYGGGKTALAHMLAHELLRSGFSRYLISNTRSVWRDDPAKVQLRDGVLADSVMILDEGGMFLQTGREADQYLAFMRKMNIVLIIPSVQPPSARVRFLTVQRFMTLGAVGLPMWLYSMTLMSGGIREQMRFAWWKPQEIFGIYDTVGAPTDDGGIDEYLKAWTVQLKSSTRSLSKYRGGASGAISEISQGVDTGGSGIVREQSDSQLPAVGGIGRDAEVIAEAAEEISGAFSLFGQQAHRSRRR